LLVYQRPSKYYTLYNSSNLMMFDELSNDDKII
jgi:hypothetical protein